MNERGQLPNITVYDEKGNRVEMHVSVNSPCPLPRESPCYAIGGHSLKRCPIAEGDLKTAQKAIHMLQERKAKELQQVTDSIKVELDSIGARKVESLMQEATSDGKDAGTDKKVEQPETATVGASTSSGG